jgi:RNA polymerase sigma factor (sigma-70 family)
MHTRTDAELLNDYVAAGDDAAFGKLVARHGAFVHRACLRLLKDEHEAQDACQTVFLVLAQKARRLRSGDLSAWLYRVGHLVATETARKRMRRAEREERYASDEVGGGEAPVLDEADRQAVLDAVDAELMALSGTNREAVLLRYLRGHSQEEAARLAGCSTTALASRASRGIEEIRRRLAKRGIALGVSALAAALESEAQAAIPEALLSSTMTAVKAYAAGTAATAAVSANVAVLTKGVLNMMFWGSVKTAAVGVAAAVVVAGSGALVAQDVAQRKTVEQPVAVQAEQSAATNPSAAKAVAALFPDYEIPTWPANQPLPAAEAAALTKAEERYAAKAYAEALTLYDSFGTQFPKSAAMFFAIVRKGRCLQLMNKRYEAIKTYTEVLDYFPNQVAYAAPALLYTAQCHRLSGNTKEAVKALTELSQDKDYAKHPAAACGKVLMEGIQAASERQ